MHDPLRPNYVVSDHPLIVDKLTRMRDVRTSPPVFRDLVKNITALLVYEATAKISIQHKNTETPLSNMKGLEIKESVVIVPILRAGLVMSDVASRFFPESPVIHMGLQRDDETLEAKNYFTAQFPRLAGTTCFLMDPMLATGGTASTACDIIKTWGVSKIKIIGIIGAPEGLVTLRENHPDVEIHLAAVDSHLDGNGYIVPGLGDAGDRLFSTNS